MKAAKLTEHPSFRLLRQTDVQNVWHMHTNSAHFVRTQGNQFALQFRC